MPAPKNPTKCIEWKEKIRKAATGRVFTKEARDAMKVPHIGSGIYKHKKGYKHTKENRMKMSLFARKRIKENPDTIPKFGKVSGENHPFWKGGISSENIKIRTSSEYKQKVRDRMHFDDYTCRECKKRGCALQVNHIKPFAIFPELRLDFNNLETLCVPCHKEKTLSFFRGNKYIYETKN